MADHLTRFAGSADIASVVANTDDMATRSSGNVYADLGFDDPTEESLKADLVMGIMDEIARRGLSQTAAARLMGISQPDVSKLLRGRTGGYSLERLLGFTRALGGDVEITVKRNASERRGQLKLSVREPA
ncbi:helix-turn-helix domain-containing protein [Enterovirga aerilata]|uniref:XRE family transcriptional regulator n=1 Tax=Enterovirga aerilata TaxID=2730920 RepID=A0A849I8D4_9HYPH|nr:helix-turn-helix transcriptional regulator [Enterovirga sp. DB1703]NNM72669.1 XRE family transcriptional regulator [Enterovirga sp. DB1703]